MLTRSASGRAAGIFLAAAGAVVILAIGLLIFSQTTSGGSAEAATGGPEMVLNVKGGDCDDAVAPSECNVALGADFTLSVDAIAIPTNGYALAQTFIDFGAELTYHPAANPAAEIVWPDCSDGTAHRKQLDYTLPGPSPSTEVVSHSCLTSGLVSPAPLSSFAGNVLAIEFSCTAGDSSTLVRLIPFDHPISTTLGSLLFDPDEGIVIPKVSDLLLNCGAGAPIPTQTPTPTPTQTNTSEPPPPPATSTPTPTPPLATKGNESFADSIPISGPLPFHNVQRVTEDSPEPGEPNPCAAALGSTVWFSYTPPIDVVLTANTIGGTSITSNSDSALGVYTGTSLATLTTVACDDNGGPNSSAEVAFSASAGTTYHFQVVLVFSDDVPRRLAFNLHGPPTKGNDNFADAFVIPTSLPYTNKDDAGGATLEPGEPRPCAEIDNTVWYSYTPASSGVLAVDTDGSDYDTALAIYTGTSLSSLTNLACDDNAGFERNSRYAFVAQAGVTYYFQIGGAFYFQIGGAFQGRGNTVLNLSAEAPPIKGNDDFANAAAVSQPFPFSNKENTSGATLEPDEPQACGPTAGTVWYKLTPETDVIVRGNTEGSNADRVRLAVYTGDALSNLSLFDCGSRFFVASPGQTYYFQLGGCVSRGCTESYGSLQINLPDFPCTPEGCPELAFNIPGGDCDDPVRPQACSVPLGNKFTLSLDVLGASIEGYPLLQSFIRYGEDLLYDLGSSTLSEEMIWPDCAIGVRSQIDLTLPDPYETTSHVNHGCFTSLLGPPLASHYVGPFIQLSMTCSATPSSSDVTLLPPGHPSAGTSGTEFLFLPTPMPGTFTGLQILLPEVSALTINCEDVAPAAVGGVALSGELRGVTGQDGSAPWLWAALGLGVIAAVSAAMSALAIVRRRAASG